MATVNASGVVTATAAELCALFPERVDLAAIPPEQEVVVTPKSRRPQCPGGPFEPLTVPEFAALQAAATPV